MTSLGERVRAGRGAGRDWRTVSASAAIQPAAAARAGRRQAPPSRPPPHGARLSARPHRPRSARGFDGRVGIAVRSVNDGWQTGWKADELYPQQSVSKLWVAITALDAVDKGRVGLDDKVTLTRNDLTLFHQPIAAHDPRRRLHHHARRPDVQGDHHQRQHRQRQVDALGRRAGGGARR